MKKGTRKCVYGEDVERGFHCCVRDGIAVPGGVSGREGGTIVKRGGGFTVERAIESRRRRKEEMERRERSFRERKLFSPDHWKSGTNTANSEKRHGAPRIKIPGNERPSHPEVLISRTKGNLAGKL